MALEVFRAAKELKVIDLEADELGVAILNALVFSNVVSEILLAPFLRLPRL